jgi:hypothetical protein
VLGDLANADGDTSLVLFPRRVTPNAHALAERFGIFDRFHTTGEVSGDGHNWSMAGYASDYLEKTLPSVYSDRGRSYDYNGTNRDELADDDVNEGSRGYLWDAAARRRDAALPANSRTWDEGKWVAQAAARAKQSLPGVDDGAGHGASGALARVVRAPGRRRLDARVEHPVPALRPHRRRPQG